MSEAKILEHNPLNETETILSEGFYGRPSYKSSTEASSLNAVAKTMAVGTPAPEPQLVEAKIVGTKGKEKKPKPTHYKVVCISLYTQDIENLEATVAELKRRGHTKANKSQLIRQALRQLDIDKLPPPQQ